MDPYVSCINFVEGLLLTGDVQSTTVTLSSRRQPRRFLRHLSIMIVNTAAAAAAAAATFQRGCIVSHAAAFWLRAVCSGVVCLLTRAATAQTWQLPRAVDAGVPLRSTVDPCDR